MRIFFLVALVGALFAAGHVHASLSYHKCVKTLSVEECNRLHDPVVKKRYDQSLKAIRRIDKDFHDAKRINSPQLKQAISDIVERYFNASDQRVVPLPIEADYVTLVGPHVSETSVRLLTTLYMDHIPDDEVVAYANAVFKDRKGYEPKRAAKWSMDYFIHDLMYFDVPFDHYIESTKTVCDKPTKAGLVVCPLLDAAIANYHRLKKWHAIDPTFKYNIDVTDESKEAMLTSPPAHWAPQMLRTFVDFTKMNSYTHEIMFFHTLPVIQEFYKAMFDAATDVGLATYHLFNSYMMDGPDGPKVPVSPSIKEQIDAAGLSWPWTKEDLAKVVDDTDDAKKENIESK